MDVGSVIKLSDNAKYLVVNQIIYSNKEYYQLLKVDSESNFIIMEKQEENMILVTDQELILNILLEMGNNLSN